MYTNMKKIYESVHPVMFNAAIAYIMDEGFNTIEKLTDEDIESFEGNALMTKDFVQGIVRTAREIVKECNDNPIEIIQFCQKKRIFDTKYYK